MNKNENSYNNSNSSLIEKSRDDIHSLKNCKAAFRLLVGSLLTGFISSESADSIIEKMMKSANEDNPIAKQNSDFLKDIQGPVFKDSTTKYKYINKNDFYFGNKKILFIEDNFIKAGWKDIFALFFKNENIEHLTTELEAIEYLKKNEANVACIFLDLRLPDSENDGLKILEKINHDYSTIPVVIFSASDSVIYARKAFELGAWDFFPKEPSDSENRNPIDYFLTFHQIVKKIVNFHENYVEKYLYTINIINIKLKSFENEQGSGLTNIVKRELVKAYKHLIFAETNNYLPNLLVMDHYDEVIFCSSKAFENLVIFYTIRKGINIKKDINLQIDSDGSVGTVTKTQDIMETLKGLGKLISNIQENNSMTNKWVKEAFNAGDIRNKYIHGYLNTYHWKSSETRSASKKTAIDFLKTILVLMEELLANLQSNK